MRAAAAWLPGLQSVGVIDAVGQEDFTDADAHHVISEMSRGLDKISFQDFQRYQDSTRTRKAESDQTEALMGAFSIFSGGTDFILPSDLRRMFANLGRPVTDAEAEQMVKAHDFDKDGKLSFEEFQRLMENDD